METEISASYQANQPWEYVNRKSLSSLPACCFRLQRCSGTLGILESDQKMNPSSQKDLLRLDPMVQSAAAAAGPCLCHEMGSEPSPLNSFPLSSFSFCCKAVSFWSSSSFSWSWGTLFPPEIHSSSGDVLVKILWVLCFYFTLQFFATFVKFCCNSLFSGGNNLRVEFSQLSSRKKYFVATSSALALNAMWKLGLRMAVWCKFTGIQEKIK